MPSFSVLSVLSLILVILFAPVSVRTADTTLSCPDRWKDGETVKLECRLNTTRFNSSVCTVSFTGIVTFKFRQQGQTVFVPACQLQGVTPSSSCNAQTTVSGVCRCKGVLNGQYVVEITVPANKTRHDGGLWLCEPSCADDKSNLTNNPLSPSSCGPVGFNMGTSANNPSGGDNPRLQKHLPLLSLVIAYLHLHLHP